jgi:prepilin-type N-terminal cleavage/methylation domain-containing protein
MRATHRGQSGFTLIEMMIVLVLISILSAIATVTLGSSSSRAYVTTMQSDLRNLATAQEAYIEQSFAETGTATYANNVNKLPVNLSNGVQIRMRGNATGWSARATHQRVSGKRCAVFRGTIRAFPPATDEGKIACD